MLKRAQQWQQKALERYSWSHYYWKASWIRGKNVSRWGRTSAPERDFLWVVPLWSCFSKRGISDWKPQSVQPVAFAPLMGLRDPEQAVQLKKEVPDTVCKTRSLHPEPKAGHLVGHWTPIHAEGFHIYAGFGQKHADTGCPEQFIQTFL